MLTVQIFTFSPIQENTYVIYNEHRNCIIFDPGCYDEEEKQTLAGFIAQNGLQPVQLVNTHCHLDHIFGNQFVCQTYGLIPCFHPKEDEMFKLAPSSGLMYGLPFEMYSGPVKHLKEGETLTLNEDTFSILFTPGHSPGSLSFYSATNGFVISGDALFNGSIGRTDLPGGNYDQLIQSIKSQLLTLPEDTLVYSGHGPVTTIGAEKKHNPFLTD